MTPNRNLLHAVTIPIAEGVSPEFSVPSGMWRMIALYRLRPSIIEFAINGQWYSAENCLVLLYDSTDQYKEPTKRETGWYWTVVRPLGARATTMFDGWPTAYRSNDDVRFLSAAHLETRSMEVPLSVEAGRAMDSDAS